MGRKKLLVVIALMLGINLTHISMIATNKDSRENKQMLSNHNTEDHTQEHIPQGMKYISEKPMMAMRSIPEAKEEKQSDKTVKITIGKTITIDKSKEEWIDVEVSIYSELEETDIGATDVDCMGKPLYNGCYAFNGLPYGTRFIIQWQDGSQEEGIIVDRTAKYVHQKYPNRIDQYRQGMTQSEMYSIGIRKAKIMIMEE